MEPRKAAFERVLPNPKAKLLDQVREVCRLKHYSLRTEQSYVAWALRFLVFVKGPGGQWRHPRFNHRLGGAVGDASGTAPGARPSGRRKL